MKMGLWRVLITLLALSQNPNIAIQEVLNSKDERTASGCLKKTQCVLSNLWLVMALS